MTHKEIKIEVTENDIVRSKNNRSKCPMSRAISRHLKETLTDVEISGDCVYIWDEWDCPSKVFKIDEFVVDIITNWNELEDINPFEFNIKKRK